MYNQRLIGCLESTGKIIRQEIDEFIHDRSDVYDDLNIKIAYSYDRWEYPLRAFLLRMAYELGGGKFMTIKRVAASLELMHHSTLVIDDILDDSKTRNAQPSVYNKWGIKEAILIGELLHSISSQLFIGTASNFNEDSGHTQALELFESTYQEICIGQYMDLQTEYQDYLSEQEYLSIISKTTAIFIQSSLRIGAILSGAKKKILDRLGYYGMALGYAFQIRDDIIDIIGDEEFTGKPYAGDIRQKKKRLPLIHAQTHGTREAQSKINSLLIKEKLEDQDVDTIVRIIHECGSIDYSIQEVKQFSEQAINEISDLENSPQKNLLIELAEMVSTFEN